MTSTHLPNGNAPLDLLLKLVQNASSLTPEKKEEYRVALNSSTGETWTALADEFRRLCEAEIQLREKELTHLQKQLTLAQALTLEVVS